MIGDLLDDELSDVDDLNQLMNTGKTDGKACERATGCQREKAALDSQRRGERWQPV